MWLLAALARRRPPQSARVLPRSYCAGSWGLKSRSDYEQVYLAWAVRLPAPMTVLKASWAARRAACVAASRAAPRRCPRCAVAIAATTSRRAVPPCCTAQGLFAAKVRAAKVALRTHLPSRCHHRLGDLCALISATRSSLSLLLTPAYWSSSNVRTFVVPMAHRG